MKQYKNIISMLKDKISLLILSCNKFSDLWDGHIKLYNEHWPNRDFDTFIVTDKKTNRSFEGVTIIPAEDQQEWTDRLVFALQSIKTDYVFITLDDYFLIKPVNNERMTKIVDLLIEKQYDYIRFFKRPVAATREPISELSGLYKVDNTIEYSVNLYSGIWRTEFLKYTLRNPLSAWKYEVSLKDFAVQYGAKCLVDLEDDFVILDVVRKGKLLRDAKKYFDKHPGIYTGNRDVQSLGAALKLWFKTMGIRYMPHALVKPARKVYTFFGGTSFTNM